MLQFDTRDEALAHHYNEVKICCHNEGESVDAALAQTKADVSPLDDYQLAEYLSGYWEEELVRIGDVIYTYEE